MYSKQIIISSLFLLLSTLSFSQSKDFDKRLLSGFSLEEIKLMSQADLEFNTYCIENAYNIVSTNQSKENYPTLINGAIRVNNLESINFFDLNIPLSESDQTYLLLGEENKLIYIKSISKINEELH